MQYVIPNYQPQIFHLKWYKLRLWGDRTIN